jgi:hypothetical protein
MPMDVLSTIAEIIRDLLIFVAVMTGLLVLLIVVVSKMPDSNPLKRLLTALTYRVGATVAAGALAIPIEPIPGIDAAYDVAVPLLLIWYWFTFFRDAFFRDGPRMSPSPPPHGRPTIGREGR